MVEALNADAMTWFVNESAPDEGRRVELVLDARYVGQNFELAMPVAEALSIDRTIIPDTKALRSKFGQAHEMAYGYASDSDPIEIVNVRLTARAKLHRLQDSPAASDNPGEPEVRDSRKVYFDDETPVIANIYDRAKLIAGQRVQGPAIIEQLDATTPVYPGDTAVVTADAHLIISINTEGSA